MKISSKSWKSYVDRLSKIDQIAAGKVSEWYRNHPDADIEELINVTYYYCDHYGDAAGALACEMYDEMAMASGKTIPPAEPAKTATYGEVASAVKGTLLNSRDPNTIGAVAGRKVKTVGLDTLLNNSLRDGAQFAWIPSGDTCAFCIMLASNGWQKASKRAMRNGHAEHVHSNCDCTYAIRFDENTEVEGYDPDYYKSIYDNAEGDNWRDKTNYIRRKQREDPYIREKINAQKRAAYARANGLAIADAPMIDYTSAYSFANGDVDLMNALRSGNCQKACEAVDVILNSEQYGLPKSHWSGKSNVLSVSDMTDIYGRKEPDCSITIRRDRLFDIKTIIHEDLHARSYSRISKTARGVIYTKNIAIEEGTVEYLSQIICNQAHISWSNAYPEYVDALKNIKKVIDPMSSDYEFAKKLIEIPLDTRYNVLAGMVEEYINGGNIRQS
ncbi:MAG: hypothetical protein IKS99_04975, partial [Firmicutes bacterium]|nr:hypothetical protein [Bacillota bacterium]